MSRHLRGRFAIQDISGGVQFAHSGCRSLPIAPTVIATHSPPSAVSDECSDTDSANTYSLRRQYLVQSYAYLQLAKVTISANSVKTIVLPLQASPL